MHLSSICHVCDWYDPPAKRQQLTYLLYSGFGGDAISEDRGRRTENELSADHAGSASTEHRGLLLEKERRRTLAARSTSSDRRRRCVKLSTCGPGEWSNRGRGWAREKWREMKERRRGKRKLTGRIGGGEKKNSFQKRERWKVKSWKGNWRKDIQGREEEGRPQEGWKLRLTKQGAQIDDSGQEWCVNNSNVGRCAYIVK